MVKKKGKQARDDGSTSSQEAWSGGIVVNHVKKKGKKGPKMPQKSAQSEQHSSNMEQDIVEVTRELSETSIETDDSMAKKSADFTSTEDSWTDDSQSRNWKDNHNSCENDKQYIKPNQRGSISSQQWQQQSNNNNRPSENMASNTYNRSESSDLSFNTQSEKQSTESTTRVFKAPSQWPSSKNQEPDNTESKEQYTKSSKKSTQWRAHQTNNPNNEPLEGPGIYSKSRAFKTPSEWPSSNFQDSSQTTDHMEQSDNKDNDKSNKMSPHWHFQECRSQTEPTNDSTTSSDDFAWNVSAEWYPNNGNQNQYTKSVEEPSKLHYNLRSSTVDQSRQNTQHTDEFDNNKLRFDESSSSDYSSYKDYPKQNNKGKAKKAFNPPANWRSSTTQESRLGSDNLEQSADYQAFDALYRKLSRDYKYVKVKEMQGDLFALPQEYALAHCVAEDMNMGSGIAVQFRREFKEVDGLLQQRQKQGGCAYLEVGNRFIYYLVTKTKSTGKPTYETMFRSVQKWAQLVKEHNVRKLAIPRLGCGLDRLEWDKVKYMVECLFSDVDVEITVCNFQQNASDEGPAKWRNSKFRESPDPVTKIEAGTVILYFCTADAVITEHMRNLDDRFTIMRDYRASTKKMGEFIKTTSGGGNYVLYGCVVRPTLNDLFDFRALQSCLKAIQKWNKDKNAQYAYIAFEAFDDKDPLLNHKILNLMRNTLREVEIWVCMSSKLG